MQYLLIISHDADFQPTESLVGDILAWIEDTTARGKRIAGGGRGGGGSRGGRGG